MTRFTSVFHQSTIEWNYITTTILKSHSKWAGSLWRIMAVRTDIIVSKETQRFTRFLAVGGLGTLLDLGLLTVLKLFGFSTLVANSLSFSAGVVNNFVLNRSWTFADASPLPWCSQLTRFGVVSLIGLALNNTIMIFLEIPLNSLTGHPEWGYLPAKIIATCLIVFWNYIANRLWTFQPGQDNLYQNQ